MEEVAILAVNDFITVVEFEVAEPALKERRCERGVLVGCLSRLCECGSCAAHLASLKARYFSEKTDFLHLQRCLAYFVAAKGKVWPLTGL